MVSNELYLISIISYLFLCIAISIFVELIDWAEKTNSNGNGVVALGFGLFFIIPVGFVFMSSFYLLFLY